LRNKLRNAVQVIAQSAEQPVFTGLRQCQRRFIHSTLRKKLPG
jgi:hypothetical protein